MLISRRTSSIAQAQFTQALLHRFSVPMANRINSTLKFNNHPGNLPLILDPSGPAAAKALYYAELLMSCFGISTELLRSYRGVSA